MSRPVFTDFPPRTIPTFPDYSYSSPSEVAELRAAASEGMKWKEEAKLWQDRCQEMEERWQQALKAYAIASKEYDTNLREQVDSHPSTVAVQQERAAQEGRRKAVEYLSALRQKDEDDNNNV